MFQFHEDPVVDEVTAALLMTFGVAPRQRLPEEMVPLDWVPLAIEIVQHLRDSDVQMTCPD
jgi:hypothetical protein